MELRCFMLTKIHKKSQLPEPRNFVGPASTRTSWFVAFASLSYSARRLSTGFISAAFTA
jgi:hypothetical protein